MSNRLWRRGNGRISMKIRWRKALSRKRRKPGPSGRSYSARKAGPIIRIIWASRNFFMVAVI